MFSFYIQVTYHRSCESVIDFLFLVNKKIRFLFHNPFLDEPMYLAMVIYECDLDLWICV